MSKETGQGVNKGGGVTKRPLLRSQIEEAQRHTNSNMAAARYMGVSYPRYKKFAKLYGIFDRHLNPSGVGVDKGYSKKPTSIPLRDVLAGKYPDYSLARLRNRLLARNKLEPKCSLCGFDEQRITDGQVPLMLTFADGDRTNFNLDNLELRCYNCMFLTTGAPTVVNKKYIKRSFEEPEKVPKTKQVSSIKPGDYYDSGETDLEDVEITLSQEEIDELLGGE